MINISKTEAMALRYFMDNPGKDICVGDLKKLGLKHATAYSTINKLLKKNLIVKTKQIWKTRFYTLNEGNIIKYVPVDVSKIIDTRIFHALQIIRSVLIKSKNENANKIEFPDMVNAVLLIGLLSNIREDDPRMKAVLDFIKNRNIYIDDKKMEKLGKKILRAIWYG